MPTLDDLLLPVFARQHWLITSEDVGTAGGSPSAISHRLDVGRWAVADERVYRLVGVPTTWQSRLLAPILSCGPGAVASHFAAAALHEIPGYTRGHPEVTIPRGVERRRTVARVHTSTDLDRCTTAVVDGIPVTDVSRTLLDIARRVGDQRLLRAIEASRRTGAVSWAQLIATLAHHARRGRPGVARLRRVITANAHREEITDSDFELLVLALLVSAGLPEPVVHHKVQDGDRFVAEVDLAYPELKVAIELDGLVHLEKVVWERDLPRQNDLLLAGWIVLRFSWDRYVNRPSALVAEVHAARQAAASGHRGPVPV